MDHIPVLLNECLEYGQVSHDVKYYLDCTFGRGGHAREFLKKYPNAICYAVDRDETAHTFAEQNFKTEIEQSRLKLFRNNFMLLDSEWDGSPQNEIKFDLILADLGVSSPQLDKAERGFSFYHDGPLDMRMDHRQKLTAAEIVNEWQEEDLFALFRELGEVQRPARVVRAILKDRENKKFTRTSELAEMISRVEGWHKKGQHPATKFFLALRLQVNAELKYLDAGLQALIQRLSLGGRLLVISFHSSEDRIVKYALLANKERGNIITKRVLQASPEEEQKNPRSRSAKLRVFERSDEPQKGNKDSSYYKQWQNETDDDDTDE